MLYKETGLVITKKKNNKKKTKKKIHSIPLFFLMLGILAIPVNCKGQILPREWEFFKIFLLSPNLYIIHIRSQSPTSQGWKDATVAIYCD